MISEQIVNALWEDCLKAAQVNIITGEYEFIKLRGFPEEAFFSKASTIFEYMQRVIDSGLLHPADTDIYRAFADKDLFAHAFSRARYKITANFRFRFQGRYEWVALEAILPSDFSPDHPVVLFCWRHADGSVSEVYDALRLLNSNYFKILKVNLTNDTYEVIKINEHEMDMAGGLSASFSGWLRGFSESGRVLIEDREAYLDFLNIEQLRYTFRHSQEAIMCRYRRYIDKSFRWVSMELLPAMDYTNDHQTVMLYIRDIHENYTAELEYQKNLEYTSNFDSLTGLRNYRCFDLTYDRDSDEPTAHDTGVLYAQINGLRYRNDTQGHHKGDEYIRSFASMLSDEFGRNICYRITGGEFIVIMEGVQEESFCTRMQQFVHTVKQSEPAMASIGFAWQRAGLPLNHVIQHATDHMQLDKNEFIRKYPEMV